MANIEKAVSELKEMDELASLDSPIHSLHPLAKLITTIAYIFITVSFSKYDLSGLLIMILFPVVLFSVSGVPIKTCFYKLRFVLPLVCFVGLFNPIFDRAPILEVGNIAVSGGVISMITLMLKGVFCLMASFLLVATTSIDEICAALRKLHVSAMLVTLLLLTFRYVSVMLNEVAVMTTAYRLRAPEQKGIQFSAWGSFLGQLLLRSMDRAEELYSSMKLRGFSGNFWYADVKKAKVSDYMYCVAAILFFVLFRLFNVAQIVGSMIV